MTVLNHHSYIQKFTGLLTVSTTKISPMCSNKVLTNRQRMRGKGAEQKALLLKTCLKKKNSFLLQIVNRIKWFEGLFSGRLLWGMLFTNSSILRPKSIYLLDTYFHTVVLVTL